MSRKILLYGHSRGNQPGEFQDAIEFENYIARDIFTACEGRYRHTQKKALTNGDIILLSFDGHAMGFFEIEYLVKPTESDLSEHPRSAGVYLVKRAHVFRYKNRMSMFGISNFQSGRFITEAEFMEVCIQGS